MYSSSSEEHNGESILSCPLHLLETAVNTGVYRNLFEQERIAFDPKTINTQADVVTLAYDFRCDFEKLSNQKHFISRN